MVLAADASSFTSWLPVLIAVIGTGGVGGAIVAFIKVRPEAGQIAVTAAGGALVVQTGVIETLHKENQQLRERLENMESKVALMLDLRERVEYLEDQREKLRKRVATLERQIRNLGYEPEQNGS